MDSRTNTHVIRRTERRAKLRPVLTEDYSSCPPAPKINRRPTFRRGRYPAPLFLSNDELCGPLAAGPRGWSYKKLSTRSTAYESFRDDHGVRFKKRLSVRDVLLGCKWHLLLDEDALPFRVKYCCKSYLTATYKSSEEGMARRGRRLRRFWGSLWRKLVFRRPELDGSDDAASYIYWEDVEPEPMSDTENIQPFLRHPA